MQLDSVMLQTPFFVPFRSPQQNSPDAIAAALVRLSQSNTLLDLFSNPIQTKVTALWKLPPKNIAGGCNDAKISTHAKSVMRTLNVGDKFCLARSLATGIAIHQGMAGRRLLNYALEVDDKQKEDAVHLMKAAGIKNYSQKDLFNLKDVELLQKMLEKKGYRIIIFSQASNNSIVYKGSKPGKNIFIYHEADHFSYIDKPEQLFNARNFCIECEKKVYVGRLHGVECPGVCKMCTRFGRPQYPCKRRPNEDAILCKDCNFWFETRECYAYHKATQHATVDGRSKRRFKSLCQMRWVF